MNIRLHACFLTLLLLPALLPAQLNISVNVAPPYSANYAAYFETPERVRISITNTSSQTRNIYLAGSIRQLAGNMEISTSPDRPWPGAPLVIPPGLSEFTGIDLRPFVEGIEYNPQNVDMENVRNGILPEGEYQICLQAFDYNDPVHPALSQGEPMGCSTPFFIQYPPPPVLTAPVCEEFINGNIPTNLQFNWYLPTIPPQPSADLRYAFKLVFLPEGIDPVSALQSTPPGYRIAEEMLFFPQGSFVLTPLHELNSLMPGQRYAWWVRAYDVNNRIVFQNDGYSEPCTFTYTLTIAREANPATDGIFTMTFPLPGDTLPWRTMPFVTKFDVYNDAYRGFESDFSISGGGRSDNFNRRLRWPNGPEISQENELESNLEQWQAQYIGVYKRADERPITFTRGQEYQWEVETELDYEGNPRGNMNGSFVSGMGRPQPVYPENGDTIYLGDLTGDQIRLRFLPSRAPAKLFPEYDIRQKGPGQPAYMDGVIDEFWFSQVRSENNTDDISNHGSRAGADLFLSPSAHGTSCRDACAAESLYVEQTHSVDTTAKNGWYTWRVGWLRNPDDVPYSQVDDNVFYIRSPEVRFYIARGKRPGSETASSTGHEEETAQQPAPEGCVSTCDAALPEDKVAIDTIKAGDYVKIGLFRMKVNEISYLSKFASGKGVIEVPFMRAPIRVDFNVLEINKKGEAFAGVATAAYDNKDIIPSGLMRGLGMMADFTADEAKFLDRYLNGTGRFISQMAGGPPTGLPIGIDQTLMEGVKVTVGIVAMEFHPGRAMLNAVACLETPAWYAHLGFGARNICFHPDGIGGPDGTRMLYLASNFQFPVPFSGRDSIRLNATTFEDPIYGTVRDSGTYVTWDCQGFRSWTVDGEVIFSPETLAEDLADGSIGTEKIRGGFRVRGMRGRQFITRIHFNKPFQIPGAEGWGLDIQEAWYDNSELENPPGSIYPPGYGDSYNIETNEAYTSSGWTGFFLKKALLRLPKTFKLFGDDTRITTGVENVVVDGDGVTGSLRAYDVISINRGDIAGWGFSMDTLRFDLIRNSFHQGGFTGSLKIPFSDSLLYYSALCSQTIDPLMTNVGKLEFNLRVLPKDTINAPLWKIGKMALLPTSHITMNIGNENEPAACAQLSGNMTIEADLDRVGQVSFRLMEFTDLTFQTARPRLSYTAFSFNSPPKYLGGQSGGGGTPKGAAGGFPVNITDIDLTYRDGADGELGGMAFSLNLVLNDDENLNAFQATTRIAILGRLNTGLERAQRWEYYGVEFDSVGISGDVGAVSIRGGLKFLRDDATYGTGMRGFLHAEFKPRVKVQVAGQFGTVNGFRYWFVDAQTVFNPGIALFPGINAYGFGGGAWYHMRQTSEPPSARQLVNSDTTGKAYTPGLGLSPIRYVPDSDMSLGVKATLIFGTVGDESAFNGDVTLSVTTGSGGAYGIREIALKGNAYFMSDLKDDNGAFKPRGETQVHAEVEIKYDFVNDNFSCIGKAFVNIKGGLVKGDNDPKGLAGQIEIFVSSETWHIKIGEPDRRISLRFLNMFTANSYLMVGKNLPPPPGVPPELGLTVEPGREEAKIEGGNGFAFGASVQLSDTLSFAFLRLKVKAGIGFDISVLNSSFSCHGMDSGEQAGVDGWYARGQLYGYFEGSLSIYVDAFGVKGEIDDIMTLGAAALLRAGLPNPTWMQGYVRVHYSLFMGAISGDHQFEMNIGDKCLSPQEGMLSGLRVISDLVPADKEGFLPQPPNVRPPGSVGPRYGVDCAAIPEAVFDIALNREFSIGQLNSSGQHVTRRFRLQVEKFELKNDIGLVGAELKVAADGRSAALIPSSFLKPESPHTLTLRIRADEFKGGGWQPAYENGNPIFEERVHRFKTDRLPDVLRPNDVAYSLPFHNQRFFLQDECDIGFIQVKQTNPALFDPNPAPNKRRKLRMLFIPLNGGEVKESDVWNNWNCAPDWGTSCEPPRIYFNIPPLLNSQVYMLQLIGRDSLVTSREIGYAEPGSTGSSSGIPRPNIDGYTPPREIGEVPRFAETTSTGGGLAQIRRTTIQTRQLRDNEKLLYQYYFRTSRYNKLHEKTAGLTHRATTGRIVYMDASEQFDVFDVSGSQYSYTQHSDPLIVPSLVSLYDSRIGDWNTSWATPLIYDYYTSLRPLTPLRFFRAEPDLIGIPPTGAIRFHPATVKRQPLTSGETAPQPLYAPPVFEQNYEISLDGATSADVVLQIETSVWTQVDYFSLLELTYDAISRRNSPYAAESFIPEPARTRMINYLESSWKPMSRGQYGFGTTYRHNVRACINLIPVPVAPRKSGVPAYRPGTVLYTY